MTHFPLALFLLVFGLNILLGLSLPVWIIGLLACVAGVALVVEYFRLRQNRR